MNSTTPPAPTGTAAMLVNDAGQYLLHLRDANKPEICDPGTRTGVTSSARVVLQPDGAQPTEQP
ncbi:hypothetical protein ACH4UR_34680 [Streptomyces lydicus]|uniref:hypothetical protein n=1 Tax=Streptomyces lydicus TaxID=47763 RepID=UPI003410CDE7